MLRALKEVPTVETRHEIVLTCTDVERLTRMLKAVDGPHNSLHAYAESLRAEIARATVVPADQVAPDVVTMKSRVKVRDTRTRKLDTYILTYPWEAGTCPDALSVLAPLGTALLGTRTGDTIPLRVPGATRTLRIEAVLYQPEAAGHYDL